MQTPRPDRQRREKTLRRASGMLRLAHLPPAGRRPKPDSALSLVAPFPAGEQSFTSPQAKAQRAAIASSACDLAHDARNLFSALHLYCDLLASPGVLAPAFVHYAGDLRMLGETGIRLIEALSALAAGAGASRQSSLPIRRRPFPGIDDLAAELLALEAPLRALAGPAVRLEVECAPCAGPVALNGEDLFRILFNLVANSVEAMMTASSTPRRDSFLRITAQRGGGTSFVPFPSATGVETVVLSVRDNGPGIAGANLEHIFERGFSTREMDFPEEDQPRHKLEEEPAGDSALGHGRGQGLTIVRQLVEAAGGAVRVLSSPGCGARFDIELPVVAGFAAAPLEAQGESRTPSDGTAKRFLEIPAPKRKRSVPC